MSRIRNHLALTDNMPKIFQNATRRECSRGAECTSRYTSTETNSQQRRILKGEGHSIQGFTLLELLLVLVLLTAITVSGLGMYEIKLRNFKVDKTALQMQQWLQAGLAFYLDCQQWPPDSRTDQNILLAMMGQAVYTQAECPALVNQKRMYMPVGSDQNGPWVYRNASGETIENHYEIAPIKNPDGTDSKVFSVSTVIGNSKTLQSSAAMIAGRLPNAEAPLDTPVGQRPIVVRAYVNASGGGGGTAGGGFIVNMQNVSSQTESQIQSTYKCPLGMEYKIFYGLSKLHTRDVYLGKLWGVHETRVDIDDNKRNIVPTLTSIGNCQDIDCNDSGGQNTVLLISACLPQVSHPLSNLTLENNSGNHYARF